ncbi:MAG: ABC transporter ATP-binding protein [Lachnospirales bacterium]
MSAITVQDLDVAYDDKYIIKNLNLEIPKGKITMIIGSNGCGKSTLLKSISRILKAKKGDILINSTTIKSQAPKEIAKQMSILPQSPIVPSGLLVRELVSYGRFPYQSAMGRLTKEDLDIVNWAMEETGVLDFAERPVDSLSGGQRQRVWIALTLAQDTDIIVLDEPTTYLDMAHQLEILLLLKKLNKEHNRTIVMVLHELNNANKFADNLVGIKDGEILFQGAPLNVITEENLKSIYGINAKLQVDENNEYPICVDFDIDK